MEVSGQLHAPALPPRKRPAATYWIGGWGSPRADLDAVEKRKISFPCRESNSNFSAIQLAARRYTHLANLAPPLPLFRGILFILFFFGGSKTFSVLMTQFLFPQDLPIFIILEDFPFFSFFELSFSIC
jgi:hypothetical protein